LESVYEDLLDLRVAEELLERPEADRFPEDTLGHPLPPGVREQRRLPGDDRADGFGKPGDVPAAGYGQRPALLDQALPELGREARDVVDLAAAAHDTRISLISRAKFSASMRSSACARVRASVALQPSVPAAVSS